MVRRTPRSILTFDIPRRHLADVLAAIPNVGEDSDFGRDQTDKRD
jgi:hypothetical protein